MYLNLPCFPGQTNQPHSPEKASSLSQANPAWFKGSQSIIWNAFQFNFEMENGINDSLISA
jgi:hypothetical protein